MWTKQPLETSYRRSLPETIKFSTGQSMKPTLTPPFFVAKYANLWRSCCRSRRGGLALSSKLHIWKYGVFSVSRENNVLKCVLHVQHGSFPHLTSLNHYSNDNVTNQLYDLLNMENNRAASAARTFKFWNFTFGQDREPKAANLSFCVLISQPFVTIKWNDTHFLQHGQHGIIAKHVTY